METFQLVFGIVLAAVGLVLMLDGVFRSVGNRWSLGPVLEESLPIIGGVLLVLGVWLAL